MKAGAKATPPWAQRLFPPPILISNILSPSSGKFTYSLSGTMPPLWAHPALSPVTDGAPEALLDGPAEVCLEPLCTKSQALGTTEYALADKPDWHPPPRW